MISIWFRCDPDVNSIPVIIIVGWRGEPGDQDEPQHITQGKVQLDLISTNKDIIKPSDNLLEFAAVKYEDEMYKLRHH